MLIVKGIIKYSTPININCAGVLYGIGRTIIIKIQTDIMKKTENIIRITKNILQIIKIIFEIILALAQIAPLFFHI